MTATVLLVLGVSPCRMTATMDAFDFGQLNVETYICYPSMCDDNFRSAMIFALYNATCNRYFNLVQDSMPSCTFSSIDCRECRPSLCLALRLTTPRVLAHRAARFSAATVCPQDRCQQETLSTSRSVRTSVYCVFRLQDSTVIVLTLPVHFPCRLVHLRPGCCPRARAEMVRSANNGQV
jgi:hypothetical protein